MFFCLWLTLEILEKSTKAYLVCLWYVLVLDAREVNDEINDRSLVGVLFVYVYLKLLKMKKLKLSAILQKKNQLAASKIQGVKRLSTTSLSCDA